MSFKITLFDTHPQLMVAWQQAFAGVANVAFASGDFRRLEADAIVSPANSFGFMDGGIDQAYTNHFGQGMADAVRLAIHELPFNELPVGSAVVVETGNAKIPHLIAAPTMRVPKVITDHADVYLATRAAFATAAAMEWHVLCPGMGTGCGGVNPVIAAARMRQAYEAVVHGQPKFKNWREAQAHHNLGAYCHGERT